MHKAEPAESDTRAAEFTEWWRKLQIYQKRKNKPILPQHSYLDSPVMLKSWMLSGGMPAFLEVSLVLASWSCCGKQTCTFTAGWVTTELTSSLWVRRIWDELYMTQMMCCEFVHVHWVMDSDWLRFLMLWIGALWLAVAEFICVDRERQTERERCWGAGDSWE